MASSLDDVRYPSETDDVVSVGVDDLYFLETDSIVSAGLDGFVLHVPPSEAYFQGEWVMYFSPTRACMVPAKIAGPGGQGVNTRSSRNKYAQPQAIGRLSRSLVS